MAANGAPPKSELGTIADPANIVSTTAPGIGWQRFVKDSLEHVPELQWRPLGKGLVGIYHQMRGDAQVQGIFLGMTLPTRRYDYHIDPNGARDEIVQKQSEDYNLPIRGSEGDPRGRAKRRFSWEEHLRHAMLSLIYGHMYFEQVGEVGPDGLWHCRKLGVRMPQSIKEFRLETDGMLRSIVQASTGLGTGFTLANASGKEIKINRLLGYVFEREGGDWTGRSMFRGIYKNWLLKDRVLRVGAINIERAGGVPYIRAPRGAGRGDMTALAQMAQQFRVGEDAGGAIPHDAELLLAQAAGGDEAVNYVKLQNEEMGRGLLMMFMNLGQTISGSRNLGGNFIDYALNVQEVIADFICDTFSEHQLEDDVDWNYGEEEPYAPRLGYVRNDDKQLAVQDLVAMINEGLISMDDQLEAWVRESYRMPRRDPDAPVRPVPSASGSSGGEPAADGGQTSPALGRSRARADLTDMGAMLDIGMNREVLAEAITQQLVVAGVIQ